VAAVFVLVAEACPRNAAGAPERSISATVRFPFRPIGAVSNDAILL